MAEPAKRDAPDGGRAQRSGGYGAVSIRIDPSGYAVVKRFETAYVAASFRGRVAVRDEEALHISIDGGASWERVEAPPSMAGLRVSEIGLAGPGHYFRIGWGTREAHAGDL